MIQIYKGISSAHPFEWHIIYLPRRRVSAVCRTLSDFFFSQSCCFWSNFYIKACNCYSEANTGRRLDLRANRHFSCRALGNVVCPLPASRPDAVVGRSCRRCRRNWTLRIRDWYLNASVGGALGFYDFDDSDSRLGAYGSCAFGCHFKNAPIPLEADYRPAIGAVVGDRDDWFLDPGLSVEFRSRDSGN